MGTGRSKTQGDHGMFDNLDDGAADFGEEEAFHVLRELEKNTPDEIRRQRSCFRVAIKSKLTLQSGNASQLLDFKLQGTTGDISEGGLGALFPLPARVGDIYRLEFDQEKINLPMTFARCVRCSVVREEAYDCGFRFFRNISLPDNLASAAGSSSQVRSS